MVFMHAAALSLDLHIPASRSLKAKRAVVRPIVDGLRHRFHVSVAEVGFQDQWQRALVGVAVVAESDGHLRELLDTVERFVVARPDVELVDVEIAWLEVDGPLAADGIEPDPDVTRPARARRA
jgi:uncharacterized protein YlxP (DUF503 family)